MTTETRTWWRDAILVFLVALVFFCIGLGARPYLTPSEARYIEIPRQMLATGDWLTPRINGVPYFEKPPLFYWMQAMSMQILGNGEFAGRIATAKLAALLCTLTYAMGRLLYGRRAGLLSATVLATCLLGYGMSRIAQLDMPVSFFLTASIAAFLAAQQIESAKIKTRLYLLMYVAAALAVMTKGLIGIVIPGIVIGAWIGAMRHWHILKEAKLILGSAIFLLIAAPWHIAMAHVHPDFLNFYFIHEHVERFLSDEHKRTAPWWFFLMVIAAGLLPWTGLLPGTLRRMRPKEPVTLFLLLWIALPLLFFSSSHSKLVPYIFPVFPPLCLLLGRTLADIWSGALSAKALRAPLGLIIAVFGAALIAVPLLTSLPGKIGRKLAVLDTIPPASLAPLAIVLALLVVVWLLKRSARVMIIMLALFGAATGLTVNYLAASFDTDSIKPLAQQLNATLQPGDTVVAYGSYWQDLPVYLNRNVTVAGYLGELEFGITHYPETHGWMIPADAFPALCTHAPGHVYVFLREGAPPPQGCDLHVSGTYGKTVLLEKNTP